MSSDCKCGESWRVRAIALAETCNRLLQEGADRDAQISRLKHERELAGRAVERMLEVLHAPVKANESESGDVRAGG